MEGEKNLSENQFGFRKGRSTEDAIRAVVDIATKARRATGTRKGFFALVSIDIRNAFNTTRWKNCIAEMMRKKIPDYLLRMMDDYLSNRWVIHKGDKWSIKIPKLCLSRTEYPSGTRRLYQVKTKSRALCSSSFSKCLGQPCYPEKSVLGTERCSNENYLNIPKSIDKRCAGPGERFVNRLIDRGKAGGLSAPWGDTCGNNEQEIARMKESMRKDARREGMARRPRNGHTVRFRSLSPSQRESTVFNAFLIPFKKKYEETCRYTMVPRMLQFEK